MAGFDGKTCPGCDNLPGGVKALMFNAMNRFGEPKMMEKLWDLKTGYPTLGELSEGAHFAIKMMHAVHAKIIVGMNGVTFEPSTGIIRWVPGTMQYLMRLETEWVDALYAYEMVQEEHQRDERHCTGGMNILRESRGSKHTLWGRRPDASYNHFVRRIESGLLQPHRADLRCTRCSNEFEIADHFKDQIRSDPTFYGAFDCPKCFGSAGPLPWARVEVFF